MKTNRISQREARSLRKRVAELERVIERERRAWSGEYVGGVHLGEFTTEHDHSVYSAIHTSRRLGHAVVVVSDGYRKFNLYALPHPKVPA